MEPEEKMKFIDDNCRNCKRQKPRMPRARCDLWHGLAKGSPVIDSITHTFVNEDGTCKYIEAKEA